MVVRFSRGHGACMTVLAAYDPQTLDSAPVHFAAAAARFADVPLVIASIRADVAPAPSPRVDLLGEELDRLRDELTRDDLVDVRARIVKASPPASVTRALRNMIEEEHASLVAVGSSKRGVIGRVAPGTTAQRIINRSSCPVVVVPHGYEAPTELTTVGVAFVPTAEGRRALHEAAMIARMCDADLRVLIVGKPGLDGAASGNSVGHAAEHSLAQLEAALADVTDGLGIESEVLVGEPADALVRVSADLDLLVMGSRGYGPRLGVLLGSVSRQVTMKAECPVLVVPRGSTSWLAPWAHRTAPNGV
jgi:nucleotide-binding universal stress UspA family protein